MADFKQLYEEKVRLEERIGKAKKQLAESEARLATVNKETEQESNSQATRAVDRQAWFDQERP